LEQKGKIKNVKVANPVFFVCAYEDALLRVKRGSRRVLLNSPLPAPQTQHVNINACENISLLPSIGRSPYIIRQVFQVLRRETRWLVRICFRCFCHRRVCEGSGQVHISRNSSICWRTTT